MDDFIKLTKASRYHLCLNNEVYTGFFDVETNHYSLETIIAVGFKVNSERAVQFRKWVNDIAKNYTIKGWVMDDERFIRKLQTCMLRQ